MPKTEVLLIQNVVGLGGESDLVKIASGYARNYLIPHGLAVPVSQGNKRRVEALRQRRAEREAKELSSMSELGKSLGKVTLTIAVKTGDDGKMFGSVTSGSIADALKTQLEVSLDKRKIHLEKPIKPWVSTRSSCASTPRFVPPSSWWSRAPTRCRNRWPPRSPRPRRPRSVPSAAPSNSPAHG